MYLNILKNLFKRRKNHYPSNNSTDIENSEFFSSIMNKKCYQN